MNLNQAYNALNWLSTLELNRIHFLILIEIWNKKFIGK